MKGVSFAYRLSISYEDVTLHRLKRDRKEMWRSSFSKRKHKKNKENDLWRRHFEFEFTHPLIQMLDEYQNNDKYTKKEKLHEQKLFESISKKAVEAKNFDELIDLAFEYVSYSSLVNDTNQVLPFLRKWQDSVEKSHAFEARMSQTGTNEQADKLMSTLHADLKEIWGRNIDVKDTSVEAMREDFTDFQDIIEELENETPPISMGTDISFNLQVTKHKGLRNIFQKAASFVTGNSMIKSGTIPLWELPTRFLEIQRMLGFAPKDVPDFWIRLECTNNRPDSSYRISAQGNSYEELLHALKEKIPEHDPHARKFFGLPPANRSKETDIKANPQDPGYRLYIHNYGAQSPLLLQSPSYATLGELFGAVKVKYAAELRQYSLRWSQSRKKRFFPRFR